MTCSLRTFADGTVAAFDTHGDFGDHVRGADGKPLVNPGIWALLPGNGASLGADRQTPERKRPRR